MGQCYKSPAWNPGQLWGWHYSPPFSQVLLSLTKRAVQEIPLTFPCFSSTLLWVKEPMHAFWQQLSMTLNGALGNQTRTQWTQCITWHLATIALLIGPHLSALTWVIVSFCLNSWCLFISRFYIERYTSFSSLCTMPLLTVCLPSMCYYQLCGSLKVRHYYHRWTQAFLLNENHVFSVKIFKSCLVYCDVTNIFFFYFNISVSNLRYTFGW